MNVEICSPVELISILSELDAVRASLDDQGFKMPSLEVSMIESIRQRSAVERDYSFYLNEKLLESISFPKGRWRRSARQSIKMHYRSAYIELLCQRFNSADEIYGSDNQDVAVAYFQAADRNADPNYLLYSRLDFADAEKSRMFAQARQERLAKEVIVFDERINRLLSGAKEASTGAILRMFSMAAEQAGIVVLQKKAQGSPKIVLEGRLRGGCSAYLDWSDELVLRKWGQLQIAISLNKIRAIPDDAAFIRTRLDDFIPGAEWYARTGGDMPKIALGILFHIEFIRLLKEYAQNKRNKP